MKEIKAFVILHVILWFAANARNNQLMLFYRNKFKIVCDKNTLKPVMKKVKNNRIGEGSIQIKKSSETGVWIKFKKKTV